MRFFRRTAVLILVGMLIANITIAAKPLQPSKHELITAFTTPPELTFMPCMRRACEKRCFLK